MITKRRKFIQNAAVSAAAAFVLPGFTSSPENQKSRDGFIPNNKPLKLGLMTYLVAQSWDIDTIIKNCTEAKYEHVQLRTTHKHGVEVTMTSSERAEVRKRFRDAGIAISLASGFEYHSTDQSVLRKNIEGTKEYLQLAADVGALGIRVFPNAIPKEGDPSREKIMVQIAKSLSECATAGHNLGVEVRVEEHGQGTANIPVIKQILNYADNPYLYMIWNNSDSDYTGKGLPKGYEGMTLEAQFNLVKDRIRNVHLRELFTDYPWRNLFSLLSKAGYNGYLDIELSDESCEPVRMMKNYRVAFLALQNAI